MRETVDAVIIGCGEAGICAAWEPTRLCPELKVAARVVARRLKGTPAG